MRSLFLCTLCILPALINCSHTTIAGGGTEGGNVNGIVAHVNGNAAAQVQVMIIPSGYNPVSGKPDSVIHIDTTNDKGEYSFARITAGSYMIQVRSLSDNTRTLISGIVVADKKVQVATGILQVSGTIQLTLPATFDLTNGYVYLPGTTFFTKLNGTSGMVVLDSVPSGIIPVLCYATVSDSAATPLRYAIPVSPFDTSVVYNVGWKHALRIGLNTASSGANVSETETGFPVLVRLTQSDIDFSQVQTSGADIRFTKANGTSLPYEIERWDPVNKLAEVWVKVDTILGNDSAQSFILYWGASTGSTNQSLSDGAAVFDTGNGFAGVWHMNENPITGNASVKDRTVNAYNATPTGSMTSSDVVDGTIGKALHFNGVDDYLDAGNVSLSGVYSVGLWVLLDTIANYQRFIFKDSSYTLWYDKDSVSVRMEHMGDSRLWRGLLQDGGTRIPMTARTWHYYVATYNGDIITLYQDGDSVSVSKSIGVNPRINTNPLLLGQAWNTSFVNGIMDEIRIEKTNRSADWIKLCYMNQRPDDKLVVFKK